MGYKKYQEYVQKDVVDGKDVMVLERDEEKEHSAFGKAVIPMDEMSIFHLYRASKLLMRILGDMPQTKYYESIGLRNP